LSGTRPTVIIDAEIGDSVCGVRYTSGNLICAVVPQRVESAIEAELFARNSFQSGAADYREELPFFGHPLQ